MPAPAPETPASTHPLAHPPAAGGCEGAKDSVVATLAERCTQLTRLDLSECQAVSAAGVHHLAKVGAGGGGGRRSRAAATTQFLLCVSQLVQPALPQPCLALPCLTTTPALSPPACLLLCS